MKYKDLKEEDKLSRSIINALASISYVRDISEVKIDTSKREIIVPNLSGKKKYVYDVKEVDKHKLVMFFQKKIARGKDEDLTYIVYNNLKTGELSKIKSKRRLVSVPVKRSVLPIGTRDGLNLIHDSIKKASFHIGLVEANQKKTGKKKSNNYKKLLAAVGLAATVSAGAGSLANNAKVLATSKMEVNLDDVKRGDSANRDNSTLSKTDNYNEDYRHSNINQVEDVSYDNNLNDDVVEKTISNNVNETIEEDKTNKDIAKYYGENDETWDEPIYNVYDQNGVDVLYDKKEVKPLVEDDSIDLGAIKASQKEEAPKNYKDIEDDEVWFEPMYSIYDKNGVDVIHRAKEIKVTPISEIARKTKNAKEVRKTLEEYKSSKKTSVKSHSYSISVNVNDYGEHQELKYNNTSEWYGESISRYCSRYGIDQEYFTALLSLERPDSVTNELQTNPAQISPDMAAKNHDDVEIIKAPVYDEEGKLVSMDEIIVVRDNDLKVKYENKGYKVYSIKEVISDPDTSIHIGVATFAYLLNMRKGKVINATMCYNNGYPAVPKDISEEELANGYLANSKADKNYIKHVCQYLPPKDNSYSFKYLDKDDNVNVVNLDINLQREIKLDSSKTR